MDPIPVTVPSAWSARMKLLPTATPTALLTARWLQLAKRSHATSEPSARRAANVLPQPAISSGNLVLTIPAPQPDVVYTVQATTDLLNWSATGVTQTNGTPTTASYPLPANAQVFLRIVVTPAS